MLPKLSILMLLAAIVPESMSGPTIATLDIPKNITLLPKNPGRLRELMKALDRFDITIYQFQDLVATAPFRLGQSINDFSSRFMMALLKTNKGENIAFSPLVSHIAMTMILFASPQGSSTYQQLSDALALKPDYTRDYLANVFKMGEYYKQTNTGLEMASNLFYDLRGYDFKLPYSSLLYGFFGASAAKLHHDEAEDQINRYIYKHTNGMIRDLMAPDSLSTNTRLVLVGALFHKDNWDIGFRKDWTDRMYFTLLDGTETTYAMGMRVKSKELRTADTKDAKVLELRYQNGFVMYVAKPHGETLADLEKVARDFNVEEVEKNLQKQPGGVEVTMPGIEVESDTNVMKVLKEEMGVEDIFDFDKANLHHLTSADGMAITEVQQQTKFKVDEEGSTASSTISVAVCLRDPNLPECLEFDRPYAYFLVDRKHGTIVLAGIVFNPAGHVNPGASPSPSPKPL